MVELRHAVRRLRRSPGFALLTVLTLAVGIGSSTAMFSTVRPVLFDSLPYPASDRLVVIADGSGTGGAPLDVTFGTFRELVARSRSIAQAAVTRPWQPTLAGNGDAERLEGQSVSAAYFRVLGVAPAIGRDFSATDDAPGAPPVCIVSDGLWRRRLGADPQIVGRTVRLDGTAVTIVGVMPAAFENVWNSEARVWRPLGYDPSLPLDGREWGHHLQLLARLAPGVPVVTAQQELSTIARSPVSSFPRPAWASLQGGMLVTPLQHQVMAGVAPAVTAVTLATCLLLLIAAVNVTSLMMARVAERQADLTTRVAVGATRLRLMTPWLIEALLLTAAGGIAGVVVGYGMVHALVTMETIDVPRLEAIRVDRLALAFAGILSAGIGAVAGGLPVAWVWRRQRQLPVAHGRMTTPHRLRHGFVAIEVALALLLLVGAGLLVRTVQRLLAIPAGFNAERVLTLQVQTSGTSFRDTDDLRQFFDRVRDSVAQVPGVTSLGLTSQLPLTGESDVYGVTTALDARLPANGERAALRYAIDSGYVSAMGIPVLQGRGFDDRDRGGSQPVALVSASFAKRRLIAGDPLGQWIVIGTGVRYRVVGVVGDVKQSLIEARTDAVYVPEAQWRFADRAMWIVVRTSLDPSGIEPVIRRAIRTIDPDQLILRVATLDQRVAASVARQRFVMLVFDAFAVIALLLATVGIYGILSGGVVERTREIAVRSAVGATRAGIIRLVVRQAGGIAAGGMVIGFAAAVAGSRALTALLFEISPLDATTYAAVAALLLVATLIGALIPAWRAANISPSIALQSR